MKVVLLQDEIHLPSFAGGTKANRLLLEGLASRGHECVALTRALTTSADGPRIRQQFKRELTSRGAIPREVERDVFSYLYEGVHVEALDFARDEQRTNYITRRIQSLQPDWVLVADDKRRFMLEAAIQAGPDRVVLVLQTIMQLPFGPLAVHESRQQTRYMREARLIMVISDYMKGYIEAHSALRPRVMWMPVYGQEPFPNLARFDAGAVMMINPCELKGVSIFLSMARAYPDVEFAAVPTWGADQKVLGTLRELSNVHIVEPLDDIEEILARTRILLVPSLWPETFGYVVPEAMLRGIPVLASNIGGLPEAKLGVDYLLPVSPAQRVGGGYVCPPQQTEPWSQTLGQLLCDSANYERCSRESRIAATEFFSRVNRSSIEEPADPALNQRVKRRPGRSSEPGTGNGSSFE